MESMQELFSRGRFFDLVDQYLEQGYKIYPSHDSQKNRKNLDLLYHLLAACQQCGYYCNYLDILEKYNQILPLKHVSRNKQSLIIILDFALESLLYCLYNNESENLGIKYDISEKIEKVISFQDNLLQEGSSPYSKRQTELRNLFEDYKAGKLPIYTVEYLYPFEPVVKDYMFDLTPCYPYISLEVKKVPREKDNYTSFKFKAYGLIKPDTWWRGPKWETREKSPPIRKSLEITNMMLLLAVKASPGKMVMPYSINQVSTASMFQYRWDEKETILGGTITGTDFTSDWVGGNTPWHQFTDAEMIELNRYIIGTYKNKAFVTTYHHATNLFSAGFYLESFSLLCSCAEGMIYHWFDEIAKNNSIREEYSIFRNKKLSKCDTCEYFSSQTAKKPYDGMPPSIFANIDFFYKKKCITKEDAKKMRRLLLKIRADQLRNSTAHGENSIVNKDTVQDSLDGITELQTLLVEISDKAATEKEKKKN